MGVRHKVSLPELAAACAEWSFLSRASACERSRAARPAEWLHRRVRCSGAADLQPDRRRTIGAKGQAGTRLAGGEPEQRRPTGCSSVPASPAHPLGRSCHRQHHLLLVSPLVSHRGFGAAAPPLDCGGGGGGKGRAPGRPGSAALAKGEGKAGRESERRQSRLCRRAAQH